MSSKLEDFPEDSGRIQDDCFLQFNDFGLTSDFFESFMEVFRRCSKDTNNNRYDLHSHIPQFLSSLARSWYFSSFLNSFVSTRLSYGIAKSTIRHSFFTLSLMTKSGRLACMT